ncbi:hypothetical protein VL762_12475 [Flavobacterium psychrophilum]|nr:hypothetical protein [Flavobacterium psychrophilum]
MKAIHNQGIFHRNIFQVGNYKLKYNFESNSQPIFFIYLAKHVGNYKLKYNFESNSQRSLQSIPSCLRW